jgi:predicted Zn-dependent protease
MHAMKFYFIQFMLKQIKYRTSPTSFHFSSSFIVGMLAVFVLLAVTPARAQSQNAGDRGRLEIALRLMQQQRYDDALPILERLHRSEPNTFIYFDRLVECEIELKQYEVALERVKKYKKNGSNSALTGVIEGEIEFFMGNKERAFTLKRILRCCNST